MANLDGPKQRSNKRLRRHSRRLEMCASSRGVCVCTSRKETLRRQNRDTPRRNVGMLTETVKVREEYNCGRSGQTGRKSYGQHFSGGRKGRFERSVTIG
jgi:hypothetical protein